MNSIRRLRKNFYMTGVDPRWWADALKTVFYRPVPSFPRMVQIQTRTGCNAGCVFCAYPDASKQVPKGQMSDALFEKIVNEIAAHNVTRRVSPYLMNEPFLDRTIVEKVRLIKARVPAASIVLTTNGSVLTRDIVDDIVRDNPLRALYISMQGIEKEPYESSMGGSLVFERTKANVEYLIEQRNRYAPELKIVITMVQTNRIDAEGAVAYWRSRGVESKYTKLESRGGNNKAFDTLIAGEHRKYLDCVRLLKNAYIMFDGDMILCCTDYYKTTVLGNVQDSTISEVWNSARAKEIRRDFLRGELQRLPLCDECFVSEITA